MAHENEAKSSAERRDGGQVAEKVGEEVPSKADILDEISEGYRFVKSGGKGQPIDEMHREIL